MKLIESCISLLIYLRDGPSLGIENGRVEISLCWREFAVDRPCTGYIGNVVAILLDICERHING